ncbi:hypothetical protein TNCV_967241 [Trichonephila clavipes]|nr:hypothetical protein TNCV_967241 [Trichonephila clavipes]
MVDCKNPLRSLESNPIGRTCAHYLAIADDKLLTLTSLVKIRKPQQKKNTTFTQLSCRPLSAARATKKPSDTYDAAKQAVRPHDAAKQAVRPHDAAKQAVRPHDAAKQAVRPHNAAKQAVRSP